MGIDGGFKGFGGDTVKPEKQKNPRSGLQYEGTTSMVGFENFQEMGIPARTSRKAMVILSVQFHSQEQSF
jgi:hypothetical protein